MRNPDFRTTYIRESRTYEERWATGSHDSDGTRHFIEVSAHHSKQDKTIRVTASRVSVGVERGFMFIRRSFSLGRNEPVEERSVTLSVTPCPRYTEARLLAAYAAGLELFGTDDGCAALRDQITENAVDPVTIS